MKPQSSLPSMAPKSFAPKRFFIMSLLLNLLVSFVVSFTVCAVFLNQKRSLNPEDIYNMNISSVLEIRSTASSGYSYGSGVVIDQGKILTNAHVVSFLDSGKRTTFDKIEARDAFSTDYYPLEVKSYDENNDLALLTFSPSLFPKVSTITSDNGTLQTGSACFALGNSNNLGLGFSAGTISRYRVVLSIDGVSRELIASSLTIAPGNSGGALLNSSGKLIGITSLRLRESSGEISAGFAYSVPIAFGLTLLSRNS